MAELRGPPHFFPAMRPDAPLGRAQTRRLNIAFMLWCATFALLVVVIAWATPGVASILGRMPRWVFVGSLVAFAASMLGFFIARGVARAYWAAHGRSEAAALIAARGQCPACSAWLVSTPPDVDRRTVCPTRTAAWAIGNAEGCPGCGYDMSRVPATAGPLAICPECGTLSVANRAKDGPV
jgi:hypothetical protein